VLTGVPDEILRGPDGDLSIIDYKTGRLTEVQDSLHPVYEVQLNGYAVIAEAIGLGQVESLGLIFGCADSRIPPELLFDQGFGDLFVIRVAGIVLCRASAWIWMRKI